MDDLAAMVDRVGRDRFERGSSDAAPPWAVLHDPAEHNILLLQRRSAPTA